MSPSFITRAETSTATPDGNSYALSSWEMASRLSYTLWGTMPDDMLFTAAQQNKLLAQADILAQAQRMLQDPKARAKVAEFHAAYALQGDATRWSEAAHDPQLFPAFKTTMVPTLSSEAAQVLRLHHLRHEGDVPGPDHEAGRVRRQGPGADLRADLDQHDAADGQPGCDPARGRVHARGLPRVVLVVQPHVADSARRVPRETGAVQTDPGAAARCGRHAAARGVGGPEHQPQAGRGADRGRRIRLRRVPRAVREPGRLRAGGVRQHRPVADDGEGHRRRHRQHGRRRHRRQDRSRDRPGRPDDARSRPRPRRRTATRSGW